MCPTFPDRVLKGIHKCNVGHYRYLHKKGFNLLFTLAVMDCFESFIISRARKKVLETAYTVCSKS